MKYKPTIGLEIHTELNTKSKMFCGCKNDSDEKRPNFNICEICTAQPGTLPVANEEAIKKVIKTGLALNCQITKESKFDRKNYFYPDLPKGYQISQYDQPLCRDGYLQIGSKKIRILRIHLEEDTGRLLHSEEDDYSLVDLNRAGVPLMELVTEPDIESGQEARQFAEELQLIFRYLNISDADMEKGQMRVEVNISLSKLKTLGKKVEIKNLNSFRVVQKAIEFEIKRQQEILKSGGKILQETRGWHDKKEITFSQREKEEAHDYRYFPEPDLPPLNFTKEYIEKIKQEIIELPSQRRFRFLKMYGLDFKTIQTLILENDLGKYYENVISEFEEWKKTIKPQIKKNKNKISPYKLTANYLISDLKGLFEGNKFSIKKCKITPENFAELIKMIYQEEISSKVAKMILTNMFHTGADPSVIVDENNWRQIQNLDQLEEIVRKILAENPKAVADYRAGNKNAIQFLQGQIMNVTRGAADPIIIQNILKKML